MQFEPVLIASLTSIAILFLAGRGPGYLAMLLALILIFCLEWIVKAVAYSMDWNDRRIRKKRK